MRHLKKGRKFHRKRDQRKALLRSLGQELILKEAIITTLAKAKEVQRFIEKKIERAKKGDLQSIRLLRKDFSKESTFKLIKTIAQRYKERQGGYTRIVKIGPRQSDGAEITKIELIK